MQLALCCIIESLVSFKIDLKIFLHVYCELCYVHIMIMQSIIIDLNVLDLLYITHMTS